MPIGGWDLDLSGVFRTIPLVLQGIGEKPDQCLSDGDGHWAIRERESKPPPTGDEPKRWIA
jgi:hypothetical protein